MALVDVWLCTAYEPIPGNIRRDKSMTSTQHPSNKFMKIWQKKKKREREYTHIYIAKEF